MNQSTELDSPWLEGGDTAISISWFTPTHFQTKKLTKSVVWCLHMSRAQRDGGLLVGGLLQAGRHPANYGGCDQSAPWRLQEWQLPQHIPWSNIGTIFLLQVHISFVCSQNQPVVTGRWQQCISRGPREKKASAFVQEMHHLWSDPCHFAHQHPVPLASAHRVPCTGAWKREALPHRGQTWYTVILSLFSPNDEMLTYFLSKGRWTSMSMARVTSWDGTLTEASLPFRCCCNPLMLKEVQSIYIYIHTYIHTCLHFWLAINRLTKEPLAPWQGGDFEYVPYLRSQDDENYEGVERAVMEGQEQALNEEQQQQHPPPSPSSSSDKERRTIRRLHLTPGMLVFFCGR